MLQKVSEAFQEYYYLRLRKMRHFQPKVEISIKVGSFRIKTVSSVEELSKAFQLRYQFYYAEMRGLENSNGWDIEDYDFHCDHLIIVDEKAEQIVATQRLACSTTLDRFATAQRFEIDRILSQPTIKTEVGKACVRKDYRNSVATALLWRGSVEYMKKTRSEIILNCECFSIQSARQAALLTRYFFEEKRNTPEYYSTPTLAYQMFELNDWSDSFKRALSDEEKMEAKILIPSLCQIYLNAGAFVGGTPAWDQAFSCFNFLIILRKENLKSFSWSK